MSARGESGSPNDAIEAVKIIKILFAILPSYLLKRLLLAF